MGLCTFLWLSGLLAFQENSAGKQHDAYSQQKFRQHIAAHFTVIGGTDCERSCLGVGSRHGRCKCGLFTLLDQGLFEFLRGQPITALLG